MKTVMILAERLDNAACETLASSFDCCLDSDVWLDASGVEFLGGRCLELLISASKSIAANGSKFFILGPSDRFIEHLGFLGLSPDQLEQSGGQYAG